ncbi:hypothetical protein SOVF_072990 [Spinacia oleracea]|nr:hypothetical protein SOVF_072990 [Spinacia oleracea]
MLQLPNLVALLVVTLLLLVPRLLELILVCDCSLVHSKLATVLTAANTTLSGCPRKCGNMLQTDNPEKVKLVF